MQREDSGFSYRSLVVLDKEGLVVARMLVDLPIGFGMMDALGIVKDTEKSENNPGREFVEKLSQPTVNTVRGEERRT